MPSRPRSFFPVRWGLVALGLGWPLTALRVSAQNYDPRRIIINDRSDAAYADTELAGVANAIEEFARDFGRFPRGDYRKFFSQLGGRNPRRQVYLDLRWLKVDREGFVRDRSGRRFRIEQTPNQTAIWSRSFRLLRTVYIKREHGNVRVYQAK